MIAFPNCKINIGLHILRKREDGYHDLETVFIPLPFCDVLEIIPSSTGRTTLAVTGAVVEGPAENNLCLRAYNLLAEKFPALPPVQIHLHKVIPAGAGLGGGSADGAFTLKMLNDIFQLGLTQAELLQLALQLGSDCPFFIINTPCFSTGRGEIMEPLNTGLAGMGYILVNPGIHISTAAMFAMAKPGFPAISLKDKIRLPVNAWKGQVENDFEPLAAALHPEIAEIKERLYQSGAVYAAMSGSGSTVFGIFPTEQIPAMQFPSNCFVNQGVFKK